MDPVLGSVIVAMIAALSALGVALLNTSRKHDAAMVKIDEINNAVNNVDKAKDARPLWKRIDDQSGKIDDVVATQAVTLAVLDRLVGLRAVDRDRVDRIVAELQRTVDEGAVLDRSVAAADRARILSES